MTQNLASKFFNSQAKLILKMKCSLEAKSPYFQSNLLKDLAKISTAMATSISVRDLLKCPGYGH